MPQIIKIRYIMAIGSLAVGALIKGAGALYGNLKANSLARKNDEILNGMEQQNTAYRDKYGAGDLAKTDASIVGQQTAMQEMEKEASQAAMNNMAGDTIESKMASVGMNRRKLAEFGAGVAQALSGKKDQVAAAYQAQQNKIEGARIENNNKRMAAIGQAANSLGENVDKALNQVQQPVGGVSIPADVPADTPVTKPLAANGSAEQTAARAAGGAAAPSLGKGKLGGALYQASQGKDVNGKNMFDSIFG